MRTLLLTSLLLIPVLPVLPAGCAKTEAPPAPDAGPDVEEDTFDAEADLSAALATLNDQRALSGLSPVEVDEALSAGCLNHVRYMRSEEKVVHEEDPDSEYHSGSGALAGQNANIAGGVSGLEEAVTLWTSALYQRLALLEPGVTRVGAAFEEGYACLDLFSAWEQVADHGPFHYPAQGQTGVPTSFDNPGPVNPIPADIPLPTGPILSITFAPERAVAPSTTGRIVAEDTGEEIPSFTRLPHDESDPWAAFHLNTVAVVPLLPLEAERGYRVIVKGHVDESLIEKQWVFQTAAEAD